MSDDMTDFEKVYNRVYRGTIVDTRHINSCDELWNAAIKFERGRCAKTLNDRAKQCAAAADQSDNERFKIAMLALASDFIVIEQEILNDKT